MKGRIGHSHPRRLWPPQQRPKPLEKVREVVHSSQIETWVAPSLNESLQPAAQGLRSTASAPGTVGTSTEIGEDLVTHHYRHFLFCSSPSKALMVDSAVLWVIKVLAALTSLRMICSPALSIFRIHKKRDVGVASIIPLVSRPSSRWCRCSPTATCGYSTGIWWRTGSRYSGSSRSGTWRRLLSLRSTGSTQPSVAMSHAFW